MRITNQVLIRFIEIKDQIKTLEMELKVIKDGIEASGGVETSEYLASVSIKTRTQMAGVEECSEALGRHLLDKHGLIKTHSYNQIDVKPRRKKVL